MPKPTNLSNRVVLAILESRIHSVLSDSILVLRFRGRRTGQAIELPVMYATDDESIVVVAGQASKKRWWRNLAEPASVEVRIAGVERRGIARVLEDDHVARGRAIRLYLQRFPRMTASFRVERREPISDSDLGAKGHDFVVVRIDLEPRAAAKQRTRSTQGRPLLFHR